ncbi:glycosyltransferase [Dethiosulfatarculus sandiegensis]|uniref:Glycosyl transferase family 1 n=1 Tax=Dethiosulfatarculus sandiegensis TaxID=1429043 RepID=A0A0D2J591_9BACT|nr:glycosyltransferase [Dethiosulfatarculus sandiegensis]KIX13289.1 hypothetical protein X474_15025 [Dethiosulfatarculus sandiegensis]
MIQNSAISAEGPKGADDFRVLAVTSLYPSAYAPLKYAFNRQQISALADLCRLGLVAPIPWPLLRNKRQNDFEEPVPDIPVKRPVFWYLPRLMRTWQGRAYLASIWGAIARMNKQIRPQALFATWLYPDGYAALLAAQRLGIPLTLKVHGSDVLKLGQDPARKALLHKTITQAQALIAVSRHLKETLVEMGASEDKIQVVGNGVNSELFHPADRLEIKKKLNLDPSRRLALFVGNLDPVKGITYALKALAQTPELDLVLVGQGPLLASLRAEAAELGISQRVTFALAKPHETVARYMQACDFLLLPSLSEGEPNVVLEALSTGRPVVASRVGGVPALMRDQEQGFLVEPENADELAKAFKMLLNKNFPEKTLVDSVKDRSWQGGADRILKTMRKTAGAEH